MDAVTVRSIRSSRGSASWGGAWLCRLLLTALSALTLAGATPAAALETPDSTPTLAPAPAPVFTTAEGAFFAGTSVTVTGTKDAATSLDVLSLSGGDPACTFPEGGTDFTCTLTAPGSGAHRVTAVAYSGATSSNASITVRTLTAPSLSGPAVTTRAIFGEGALPNATIEAIVDGSSYPCPAAGGMGGWNCVLPDSITEGPHSVSVRQVWPGTSDTSPSSPPMTVTIDRTPPPRPSITQPGTGASVPAGALSVSGTASEAARVEVFLNGTLACSAAPSGGAFSCTIDAIGEGDHELWALAWDDAGNSAGLQSPVAISVPAAAAPAPAPVNPGSPAPDTGPAPEVAPLPESPPVPAPQPEAQTPHRGLPFLAPPVGGLSGLPPGETWGTPTHYGAALVSPLALGDGWVLALLLGVAFVALIALPLRMIAVLLRERRPRGTHRGRSDDEAPLIDPRIALSGALLVTMVIAGFASGLQAEVRYVRLGIALTAALVLVNLIVLWAGRFAGRWTGVRTRIRLEPRFILIAAVVAVLSRVFGMQPPLIVGVVLVVLAVGATTTRPSGVIAFAQLAALGVLSVAAWGAHSLLGPVEGFWGSAVSEAFAGVVLAGVGSSALLLLPVHRLPGRFLFEWSPLAWLGAAVPLSILAAAVLASAPTFPLPWAIGAGVVLTTIASAAWGWTRFVEPAVAAR